MRGCVLTIVALSLLGACRSGPAVPPPELGVVFARVVRAPAARADVHYVAVGRSSSRLPLVFLHPWGADLEIWAEVARTLTADRVAILVDLPAHGGSSHAPGRYPPRRLAQAVLAAMDDVGFPRAVLIGNSLGAATAIAVDELAPDRVAGLVLVGTPGAIELPAPLRRALQRAIEPRALATVSPQLLERAWRYLGGASTPALDRLVDGVMERRLRPDWPQVAAAQGSALDEVVGYAPPLESVRVPTLVVHGVDDRVVWDSWARSVAARIPGAELAFIEDCGHFPQIECPGPFAWRVHAFLASLDR